MKNTIVQSAFVFLIACAVTFVFYNKVIMSPNSFLFSNGDDGIKNYYTLLYHAFHSEDPFLLTGMNYPYYEHAVFTDAAPLLSILVSVTGNSQNGVGVFNIILLLSFPLTVLFVFLILRKYRINLWWSLLAAISISMLAPQFDRLLGHYGLSFAFFIPCFWWLIISYEDSRRFIWIAITSLLTTAAFFIHPYHGLILAATGLAYFTLKATSNRNNRFATIGNFITTGILPVLVFQVFMFLTDPVHDRIAHGEGFFEYYGRIESFIHPRWPHSLFLYFKSIGIEEQPWEGAVYLGFGTILFLLVAGIHALLNARNSIKSVIWSRHSLIALLVVGIPTAFIAFPGVIELVATLEFILVFIVVRAILAHMSNTHSSSLQTFAVAASLLMLWGMCIPLKYEQMRPLADILGALSEFRSLGRFLWVPYFAITVGSVILLSRIRQQHKVMASLVFFLGLGISAFEWNYRQSTLSSLISSTPNLFQVDEHSEDYRELVEFLNDLNPDAMVFLPFYYKWTPTVEVLSPLNAARQSMLLSYQTKIPMFNISSTRLSPSQSKNVLNLFAPPFVPKEVVSDIPPDDHIVIVQMRDEDLPLEQSKILNERDIIFQNTSNTVYQFDLTDRLDVEMQKMIVQSAPGYRREDLLYDHVSDSIWFYYQSFSGYPSTNSFQGSGSFEVSKKEWNTLDEISLRGLDSAVYEISYFCSFELHRPKTKALLGVTYEDGAFEILTEHYVAESYYSVGEWLRVEHQFLYTADMESLKVLLNGPPGEDLLLIDELMIRKVDDPPILGKLEYENGKSAYVYNNFWFRTDERVD